MQLVVGLGDVGQPLKDILSEGTPVVGFDIKSNYGLTGKGPEYMHICIPWGRDFVNTVMDYQKRFEPQLTVIHSTVPIGTTKKIPNAVHSPVLGRHDNMKQAILSFTKWVGGDKSQETAEMFSKVKIPARAVAKSEWTEALKLLCLAKHAKDIAFAQYCAEVCEAVGMDYREMLEWDRNHNPHVERARRRPILYPPGTTIGGHCLVAGAKILNHQHPHPFLQEILKFGERL